MCEWKVREHAERAPGDRADPCSLRGRASGSVSGSRTQGQRAVGPEN
jgi:hypothetical protein